MRYILFVLLSALLFINNAFSQPVEIEHVIVIGVDGMSPDGIQNANTPNIDYLIKNGSSTMRARAVLPTSSSSNWASMIMGASPAQHGITSNGWERDDYILPPVTTGMEEIFPTIFGVIRQQRPEAEIGTIYHWDGFGRLFEKSAVNYDITAATEDETTDLAIDYLTSKKPVFTFIHLDHVDHAGHHGGHGSEEYYDSVAAADILIGKIVQAARQAALLDNGMILVTSDHGGIGYGHGGETRAEIEIPFILYGKNVKKGKQITHPVYTYDNAATVAFALGIDPPYAWIGRPVKSAFVGYSDPVVTSEKMLLTSPIIYPPQKFYDPPGGLFVDQNATVKITTSEKGASIYYTTDGSEPSRQSIQYKTPFLLISSAVVKARVFRDKHEESLTTTAYFRIVKTDSKNGVNFSYYEGESWIALPVFENMAAKKSGRAFQFRVDQVEHRDSQFAIQFKGLIRIDRKGAYKFYTNSDDGSALYIDDKKVVDNDGDHGTLERSGQIELSKGLHKIRIEYFNGGGGAWLDVYYRSEGLPKQIIPPDVLFISE